jgi:intracellular septation protein A
VITTQARPAVPQAAAHRTRLTRIKSWAKRHWISLAICGGVLVIVGAATGWNLMGWPLWLNDDEGTYVAQAWAVIQPSHHIAHYTYWYDHTPGGWSLMGAYFWATDALHRYPLAVMAGREFMWEINLVGCAALYVLARRLNMRRASAAAAVILFGLCPLAIYSHRMVFLDNIETVWLLVALALAASPKRGIGSVLGSSLCFSAAFWSKETVALMAPVWLWIVWRHSDSRHRGFWIAGTVFTLTSVVGYPLFALLRNELFPGAGHVSLWWGVEWQLFLRQGSGSLLDTHSQTYALALSWIREDPWLLLGGLGFTVAAVFIRRLWPIVLAVAINVAVPIKGGYVPDAYVTVSLPFLALTVAGVMDTWWNPVNRFSSGAWRHNGRIGRKVRLALCYFGRGPVVAAMLVFAILVIPAWGQAIVAQSHQDGYASTLASEAWVEHHVPKNQVVVVDDYLWVDLKTKTPNAIYPVWIWKVDLDPWVMSHVLAHGWRSINYVVWAPKTLGGIQTVEAELPTIKEALQHGVVVARFSDDITIYKVITSNT